MTDNSVILDALHGMLQDLDAATAKIQNVMNLVQSGNWTTPPHPAFSFPVGDVTRRVLAPWWVGQGWATTYPASMGRSDWHTGVDLNLNIPLDVNAAVYACADGEVQFAGVVSGWQGQVVIVKHTLEDGRLIWSRYAHITALSSLVGANVKRGELIGHIADYAPVGPSGDHLHFDLSWHDLGKTPGDWPGADIARLRVDYVDPIVWILGRLP